MKIKDYVDYQDCPAEIPDELINERRLASSHLASVKRVNQNGGMTFTEVIANIKPKLKVFTSKEGVQEINDELRKLREKEFTSER